MLVTQNMVQGLISTEDTDGSKIIQFDHVEVNNRTLTLEIAGIQFSDLDTSEDETFPEYVLCPPRFLQNCFSKGSKRSSVFTMMSATIGAGLLSLPYAMADSGLIWGSIQLIFWAYLGYYSNMLLVKSADHTKKYSYMSLARELYGKKFEFFVKIIFFLHNWGGIVVNTTLINNLVGQSMRAFFPQAPSWITATGGLFWPPVFTILTVFPLSLPRELSALRYFYPLGFVFVIYLSCAIIREAFFYGNFMDNLRTVILGENLFKFAGIAKTSPAAIFAFMCQVNTLDVYNELQRPSWPRMKKVLTKNFYIVLVVYSLVGIFGYITFANDTSVLDKTGNILLNYPHNPIPMIIAYILFGLEIILTMPLGIKPTKDSLAEIIFPNSNTERKESKVTHVVLVSIVTFSQMIAGMLIPKISLGIGFLGTTGFPIVCYIFPALFYLKCLKAKNQKERLFLVGFIVGMALFAVYMTVEFIVYLLKL